MELMLEPGHIVCLVDVQDQVIRCREGALWITEDGSPDDITLSTGQSARLDRRGKTVVLAIIASRVEIEGPAWKPLAALCFQFD